MTIQSLVRIWKNMMRNNYWEKFNVPKNYVFRHKVNSYMLRRKVLNDLFVILNINIILILLVILLILIVNAG